MCKFCRAEIEGTRDRREALHPLHRRPEADPAEPAADLSQRRQKPAAMDGSDVERIEHTNFFETRSTNTRRRRRAALGRKRSASSVVLSVAKDLIAACNRHEILRFAQDDTSVPSTFAGVPCLSAMSGYAHKAVNKARIS